MEKNRFLYFSSLYVNSFDLVHFPDHGEDLPLDEFKEKFLDDYVTTNDHISYCPSTEYGHDKGEYTLQIENYKEGISQKYYVDPSYDYELHTFFNGLINDIREAEFGLMPSNMDNDLYLKYLEKKESVLCNFTKSSCFKETLSKYSKVNNLKNGIADFVFEALGDATRIFIPACVSLTLFSTIMPAIINFVPLAAIVCYCGSAIANVSVLKLDSNLSFDMKKQQRDKEIPNIKKKISFLKKTKQKEPDKIDELLDQDEIIIQGRELISLIDKLPDSEKSVYLKDFSNLLGQYKTAINTNGVNGTDLINLKAKINCSFNLMKTNILSSIDNHNKTNQTNADLDEIMYSLNGIMTLDDALKPSLDEVKQKKIGTFKSSK